MIFLILGGRGNGLAVARSLNSPSDVFVVEAGDVVGAAKFSNYICSYFQIGNSDDEVVDFLNYFLGKYKSPVLFATDDWWVAVVSKYRESGGLPFLGFFPSISSLNKIVDKSQYFDIYGDVVSTPEVKKYTDNISDYIVKPKISFGGSGVIAKGLNSSVAYSSLGEQYIFQKKINAPLENHISVCGISTKKGIISPFFSRKILEYPIPMGTATAVIAMDCEAEVSALMRLAELIISKIEYIGIFEIEFIKDGDTYWFIDFNPRFWLQHEMAKGVGINYSILYVELSKGNRVGGDVESYLAAIKERGVLWLHEGAFINFLRAKEKFKIFKGLLFSRLYFSYFKLGDLGPFWFFIKCKLKKLLKY